ncbi:T9SS type A sorting domain-containing protein [uncultured Psychroserpens sp.]|uniref:T9SS type A sorting domain-containing protein n=1 Tax=uncultured Psychroserpens sp. TaxID=255436 RepID=UPI00262490A0|nr:T9SS type A sorting domain-containing protein [uncultured Psychroserpens sp.]
MKKTLLSFLTMVLVCCFAFAQSFTEKNIDTMIGDEGSDIASGDLDGDGDIDLVVSTYFFNGNMPTQDYIKWYKNDGNGNFSVETDVSSTITWVEGLATANIDGLFGDDIIATSVSQNKLVYFLSNGSGFGPEVVVDPSITGPGEVATGDINQDGHIDLVAASFSNNRTQWYSGDGAGGFTSETDIENGTTDGPYYIDLADFDGDTDLDVLVGFVNSQSIEIYYNQFIESGSTSVSWIKDTVTVDSGNSFLFGAIFADVNNDGAMDVVKVDFTSGNVAWFNKVKNGTSTSNVINNSSIIGNPGSVLVADIDNDTFNDVIVTDGGVVDDAIVWFKGADNDNPSSTATFITNNNHILYDITAADFDDDTDLDLATVGNASDTVQWYENDFITLSVNEVIIDQLSIYPNPTKDILNFKGELSETMTISVYDNMGKEILTSIIDSNHNTLDVSKLSSGMYIIKFEGYDANFKFMKL